MSTDDLRRTPLHAVYGRYGARTVPFGGWELPVQFSGILDEHEAVRSRAGIFDVSHMGQIWLEGPGALDAVQYLTINDASRLVPGRIQYSAMVAPEGGVIDDVLVYRVAPERFMLCVNGACVAKDRRWIEHHAGQFPGVRVSDRSEETALLALQGPLALEILSRLTYATLDSLPYYAFTTARVAGTDVLVSRTGYTGEDGFELYLPAERGPDLWEELMAVGEPQGLKPCGLGARDTLRLEMGYLLYGQDMDESTTPLEAGLSWILKTGKGKFLGRESCLEQASEGSRTRLVPFVVKDRGVPRGGYRVLADGKPVGSVTSGTLSPSLKMGIGLAYVPTELARPGSVFEILIRERTVGAMVATTPFYGRGTARRNAIERREE